MIAPGRALRLKNCRVLGARWLGARLSLPAGARLLAEAADGVKLVEEAEDEEAAGEAGTVGTGRAAAAAAAPPPRRVMALEVEAPRLTLLFPQLSSDDGAAQRPCLAAAFDATVSLRLESGGGAEEAHSARLHAQGLTLAAGAGAGRVLLAPADLALSYLLRAGVVEASLQSTDILLSAAPEELRLASGIVADTRALLAAPPPDAVHVRCAAFTRLYSGPLFSVWRPSPPPGFCALGDVACAGAAPPPHVLVLRDVRGFTEPPVDFVLVWSGAAEAGERLSLWLPTPPAGFAPLGCMASLGASKPPRAASFCLRLDSLCKAQAGECLQASSASGPRGASVWRVRNAAHTFLATSSSLASPPAALLLDVRLPLLPPTTSAAAVASAAPLPPLKLELRLARVALRLLRCSGAGLLRAAADGAFLDAVVVRNAAGAAESVVASAGVSLSACVRNAHARLWEPLLEPARLAASVEGGAGSSLRLVARVEGALSVTLATHAMGALEEAAMEALATPTARAGLRNRAARPLFLRDAASGEVRRIEDGESCAMPAAAEAAPPEPETAAAPPLPPPRCLLLRLRSARGAALRGSPPLCITASCARGFDPAAARSAPAVVSDGAADWEEMLLLCLPPAADENSAEPPRLRLALCDAASGEEGALRSLELEEALRGPLAAEGGATLRLQPAEAGLAGDDDPGVVLSIALRLVEAAAAAAEGGAAHYSVSLEGAEGPWTELPPPPAPPRCALLPTRPQLLAQRGADGEVSLCPPALARNETATPLFLRLLRDSTGAVEELGEVAPGASCALPEAPSASEAALWLHVRPAGRGWGAAGTGARLQEGAEGLTWLCCEGAAAEEADWWLSARLRRSPDCEAAMELLLAPPLRLQNILHIPLQAALWQQRDGGPVRAAEALLAPFSHVDLHAACPLQGAAWLTAAPEGYAAAGEASMARVWDAAEPPLLQSLLLSARGGGEAVRLRLQLSPDGGCATVGAALLLRNETGETLRAALDAPAAAAAAEGTLDLAGSEEEAQPATTLPTGGLALLSPPPGASLVLRLAGCEPLEVGEGAEEVLLLRRTLGDGGETLLRLAPGPPGAAGLASATLGHALTALNFSSAALRMRQHLPDGAEADALSLTPGASAAALSWLSGPAPLRLQLSRAGGEWSAPFDPFGEEVGDEAEAEAEGEAGTGAAVAAALAALPHGGEAGVARRVALRRGAGLEWIQLRMAPCPGGCGAVMVLQQLPCAGGAPLLLRNASGAALEAAGEGDVWLPLAPYSCIPFAAADALAPAAPPLRLRAAGCVEAELPLSARDGQPLPPLPLSGAAALSAALAVREAGPAELTLSPTAATASAAGASPAAASAGAQWSCELGLPSLRLSVLDCGGAGGAPEEVVLASADGVILARAPAEEAGRVRTLLRVDAVQVDDMLPGSPYRVLAHALGRRAGVSEEAPFLALAMEAGPGAEGEGQILHAVSLQPPLPDLYLNLFEPTLRRGSAVAAAAGAAATAIARLSPPAPAAPPPPARLLLLRIGRAALRLSLRTPAEAPRGGLLTGLGAAVANLDEALLVLPAAERRPTGGALVRGSADVAALASSQARRALRRQLFRLLHGVDVLHGVSGLFGAASARVASLSADSTFQARRAAARAPANARARVGGVSDGLRDGTEALARGVFNGLRGVVSKPLDGARSRGVRGFVTGVGKGLVGVAVQPVSGVLDLAAATAEGVRASAEALTADAASRVRRRRLPRHIRADGGVAAFDERLARGAQTLRLAELPSGGSGGGGGGGALALASSAAGAMAGLIFRARGGGGSGESFVGSVGLAGDGRRFVFVTSRRLLLLLRPADGVLSGLGGGAVGGRLASLVRRDGGAAAAAAAAERAEAAAAAAEEEACSCERAVELADVLRWRAQGAEVLLELRAEAGRTMSLRCTDAAQAGALALYVAAAWPQPGS